MNRACIGVFGVQMAQKNNEHEMIKVDGARCGLELHGVYRSTFAWDHAPSLSSTITGLWVLDRRRNDTYVVWGERRS